MELKGKVAVITGAGSGIGAALAQVLLKKGCHLVLNDYNASSLHHTTEQLSPAGGQIVASSAFDVADKKAMYDFADFAENRLGRVDLLINNAGVALGKASIDEVDYQDLEWIMGINFWGMVYGSKAFLPLLKKRPEAALVNISSVFGIAGIPFQGPYCASKFAIRGFTESLRAEAIIQYPTVQIHTVHPGGIKTNIAKNARWTAASAQDKQIGTTAAEKNLISSPIHTAQTIVRGIERKKGRILVGNGAKKIDRLVRCLPSAYSKIIAKGIQRLAAK
ncbi:MAG: SDR family NAD(P)-dependent oxidoreductase [Bacteroidota bacterium]